MCETNQPDLQPLAASSSPSPGSDVHLQPRMSFWLSSLSSAPANQETGATSEPITCQEESANQSRN